MKKIRNIDLNVCNGEMVVAYNFLSMYYDLNNITPCEIVEYLGRNTKIRKKHYNNELIAEYIHKGFNKFMALKYKILGSYKEIGELFQ